MGKRALTLHLTLNMASAQEKAEEAVLQVFQLFEAHGGDDYIGEAITQVEHATQAAKLAKDAGFDDEIVLAALLHDIGHLKGLEVTSERMGDCGVARHEKIGAEFLLSLGFSEKVATLVRRHVDAKRYLCRRQPSYYEKLSDASRTTLEYQGGPMTEEEARSFEIDPFRRTIVLMRTWDEKAKVPNIVVPPLESYRDSIFQHVLSNLTGNLSSTSDPECSDPEFAAAVQEITSF